MAVPHFCQTKSLAPSLSIPTRGTATTGQGHRADGTPAPPRGTEAWSTLNLERTSTGTHLPNNGHRKGAPGGHGTLQEM
jgi:hypothetical protein